MILRVVGALIQREHYFLVTRRPASSKSWPGAWEFPGGKVEPGEDDRTALRRELIEELGIEVEVGELFMEVLNHDEGPRILDLRIYHCLAGEEPARTLGVDEIRWLQAKEMTGLHFPTADRPVVEALLRNTPECSGTLPPITGRITP